MVSGDSQDAVLSDRGLPQDERPRKSKGVLSVKFRKRPIVVDAIQWDPDSSDAAPEGVVYDDELSAWYCDTLEGRYLLKGGEWIVTGVNGEHYPVQDEIFRTTHLPIVKGEDEERTREEVIFAHDIIKTLLAGKIPDHNPDGQQSEIWQAALNALCWVLGHEYGGILQGNINAIEGAIKDSGLDFMQTDKSDSDLGHAPAGGTGAFSLN